MGDGIPVLLGVDVTWSQALGTINNGGEGGCDDDALHAWGALLDRLENSRSADDGGVKQFLAPESAVSIADDTAQFDTFCTSVTLKWKGDAVWMTASKGGSDLTASSNAPSFAMSSTIAKSNCLLETPGCASLIFSAFS